MVHLRSLLRPTRAPIGRRYYSILDRGPVDAEEGSAGVARTDVAAFVECVIPGHAVVGGIQIHS